MIIKHRRQRGMSAAPIAQGDPSGSPLDIQGNGLSVDASGGYMGGPGLYIQQGGAFAPVLPPAQPQRSGPDAYAAAALIVAQQLITAQPQLMSASLPEKASALDAALEPYISQLTTPEELNEIGAMSDNDRLGLAMNIAQQAMNSDVSALVDFAPEQESYATEQDRLHSIFDGYFGTSNAVREGGITRGSSGRAPPRPPAHPAPPTHGAQAVPAQHGARGVTRGPVTRSRTRSQPVPAVVHTSAPAPRIGGTRPGPVPVNISRAAVTPGNAGANVPTPSPDQVSQAAPPVAAPPSVAGVPATMPDYSTVISALQTQTAASISDLQNQVNAVKQGLVDLGTQVSGFASQAQSTAVDPNAIQAAISAVGAQAQAANDAVGQLTQAVQANFDQVSSAMQQLSQQVSDLGSALQALAQSTNANYAPTPVSVPRPRRTPRTAPPVATVDQGPMIAPAPAMLPDQGITDAEIIPPDGSTQTAADAIPPSYPDGPVDEEGNPIDLQNEFNTQAASMQAYGWLARQ